MFKILYKVNNNNVGMYIDIVFVVLLVIMPIISYKKGFILSCIGIIGSLFCLFLTYKTCPIISNYIIDNTNIVNSLENILNIKNNIVNLPNNSRFLVVFAKLLSITLTKTSISNFIISAVVFVFLYAFLKVCIKIILNIISNVIKKMPIVGKLNSICGAVLGTCKGFIFIFVISSVIMLGSKIPKINIIFEDQIQQSALYSLFSDSSSELINVFLNYIS